MHVCAILFQLCKNKLRVNSGLLCLQIVTTDNKMFYTGALVGFENRIEIPSLALMKQRCHDNFSCTFQK